MQQISISDLAIEITRFCNMECSHCLRGEAQNKNIPTKYIDELLTQVSYINHVTFTGGEPSLNVAAMDYFLKQCIAKNITVGSFYIATNGLKINPDFVLFCLRMFSYCENKLSCCVDVSNDYYHAEEGRYNTQYLDGLSFFNRKYAEEATYNYILIAEGNADGRSNAETNFEPPINCKENFRENNIYLNCEGDIINGCNWSYESQTEPENILCNVSNLVVYYNSLPDEI